MKLVASPFAMVIFGATGDLTATKLLPSLFSLYRQQMISDKFLLVGVARRPYSNEEFRSELARDVKERLPEGKRFDSDLWERFSRNIVYREGLFEEDAPYKKLIEILSAYDKKLGACITRFFYLATPPQHYATIIKKLVKTKLSEGCGQGSEKWTRVLIEKPFGYDADTAKSLEELLIRSFTERQIYRIDHYFGKETVQNILALRFANGMFEPLWNRDYIDHVQIHLAEAGGIGNRGQTYEQMGALRDVVQNHIMAMLAYTAMEKPASMDADRIRQERIDVLGAIRRFTYPHAEKDVVIGQYGPGEVSGYAVPGYRQEKHVAPGSLVETFVALKLFIDNARWKGVPFYIRTGKRLAKSASRISIRFKKPVHSLFGKEIEKGKDSHDNVLTIRVQPHEGMSLQMLVKAPGLGYRLENAKMDFTYRKVEEDIDIDAYGRLLIDCMMGDQTLFATNAGFRLTWKIVMDIRGLWEKKHIRFPNYKAGTWGPTEGDELIEQDGRHWLLH